MDLCRRVGIFWTFIGFAAVISLVCTSLATEQWIYAKPVHNATPIETTVGDRAKEESLVHSGLFAGYRYLNYGLGTRPKRFYIKPEISEGVSFVTLSLWVCTVVFAALTIVWAVVGVIFSLLNTVVTPIETITGPIGLYVWNCCAIVCNLICVILFLVQYYTTIIHSVLLPGEQSNRFTSEDRAWLGFSFWLMVGSLGVLFVNLILLLISGLECKRHGSKDTHHITDGGVLMY